MSSTPQQGVSLEPSPDERKRVRGVLIAVSVAAMIVLALALYLGGRRQAGPTYRAGGFELEFVFAIDGPGGESPRFDRPLGVAISDQGDIFVSDTGNNRVCVFDRQGKPLREWGGFGFAKPLVGAEATWKPGLFNFPVGIDFGDDGRVYVADFRNDQVQVFEPDGTFVLAFPDPTAIVGRGASGQDGLGIAVTDVAVSGGRAYATDAHQVVVFDTQGDYLYQFGKPGSGAVDLDHPSGLTVGGSDILYVADSNHTRVVAFTLEGVPVWSTTNWPEPGGSGVADESFGLPRGMTTALDGLVLVADAVRHQIMVVDPDGNVLAGLGARGVAPGEFNFPADVDALGDTVVVADKENNRVEVFTLKRSDEATPAIRTTRKNEDEF